MPGCTLIRMSATHALLQDIPWPPWVDMFTIISHLALTLSCSISFYIYYGKYGAPKQVMNRRLTKFRSLIRPTNNNKEMEEGVEMMGLPDMDNLVENEMTLNTSIPETSFSSCSQDNPLRMQNKIEYDWTRP